MKQILTISILTMSFFALTPVSKASPACCPDGDAFITGRQSWNISEPLKLTAQSIRNLNIQTKPVRFGYLEKTIPAIGRLVTIPEKESVISSRISGSIHAIYAVEGEFVETGQTILAIQTRQPGSPPPIIKRQALTSGILTNLNVRLGQPVDPSDTLATIADFSELFVVARVPMKHSAVLPSQPNAIITTEYSPGYNHTATLFRFGDKVDPNQQFIEAYFRIPNPGNDLRPGMFCRVAIIQHEHQENEHPLIPLEAILGEFGHEFIYTVDPENPDKFHHTPVWIIDKNDRFAAIHGNIQQGDNIVTHGGHLMRYAGAVAKAQLAAEAEAAHGHSHSHDNPDQSHGDHEHHDHYLVYALGSSSALLLLILTLQSLRFRKNNFNRNISS